MRRAWTGQTGYLLGVPVKHTLSLLALAALAAGPALAADPATIDWSAVPARTLTLFYPGQSSHEWLQSDHKGAKNAAAVKRGESCAKCHDGDQKKMGDAIVKGGALEPAAVKGKNGWVDLEVRAAFDARNAYVRLKWNTLNPFPGTEHQYLRYDGTEWKVYGYPKLDKVVREGAQPGIYEDRATMMIDDGKVAGFGKQGCWLTCHNGQRDMPNEFTKDEVAANALLTAIKKTDVRKYLPDTRVNPADWKSGKPVDEIAKLRAAGGYVDLVQWRAHRSNGVGMADDGYVLEFRLADEGKDMFAGNADAKTHAPKYMWDTAKVGYRAIREADLRRADHFLVRESNAVPFDPNAGWKAGDMIPDYVLSRADAKGSAADNNAIATWKDGQWTVVLVRPLGLANGDDKALREGGVYNVGFAVHDDNITTRGHFVSFPVRLGIGAEADIKAVKLN
jgi:ethylbenzene dehydrogenase